jgi:RNA recognition motif-containing protein
MNPLAEGFEAGKAIFVTSIDINVQEAHLKRFFSFCGAIAKLKFLNYTLASPFKAVQFYLFICFIVLLFNLNLNLIFFFFFFFFFVPQCLIEFKDSSAIDTALMLNNTELLGRVIRILPSEAAEAVPASAPPPTVPDVVATTPFPLLPMPTGAAGLVPPHMMMMMGLPGLPFGVLPPPPVVVPPPPPTAAPTATNTATTSDTPAPVLKNSEMSNQQSPEELNRTVYVGNIAPPVTQVELARHMGSCGPITFTRISGGSSNPADPSRYAFVEYATVEASRIAVERLNGSVLATLSLRVSSAKNPIVKPALPAELLPSTDAKRKLKNKLSALEARLTRAANGGAGVEANSNGHDELEPPPPPPRSPRARERSRSPRR